MYIQKYQKGNNAAKPRLKLNSFKDRIESLSKKALFASMVIGSTISPLQALSPEEMATGKAIHPTENTMSPKEKDSLSKLAYSLGILASVFAAAAVYSNTGKRKKDNHR
ncbi:MAG: hypothetical protein NTY68_05195 [Candidatus Micrarchaeota archaeon]|nr:hypothetical protein [Candidatus Micrarchaeota archaeon]